MADNLSANREGGSLDGVVVLKQDWHCDSCKTKGTVEYEKHAGVWEVLSKIVADHRKKGGLCQQEPRVDFEHNV